MPHNNKQLTSTYTKWDGDFPCGISKQFDSTGQRNIWLKLHKQKCHICNSEKLINKKTNFNLI